MDDGDLFIGRDRLARRASEHDAGGSTYFCSKLRAVHDFQDRPLLLQRLLSCQRPLLLDVGDESRDGDVLAIAEVADRLPLDEHPLERSPKVFPREHWPPVKPALPPACNTMLLLRPR